MNRTAKVMAKSEKFKLASELRLGIENLTRGYTSSFDNIVDSKSTRK